MSWERTGTVTLTNGSKTVTGVGTAWLTTVKPSGMFFADGGPYEVDTVTSNTTLQLVTPYTGATVSGGVYAIAQTQGFNVTLAKALGDLMSSLGVMKDDYQSGAFADAADLAAKVDVTTLAADNGAEKINVKLPGAYAQKSNLYDLAARNFYIDRWLTKAQATAVRNFTYAVDVATSIHNALLDISNMGGGVLHLPPGGYHLSSINAGAGNESTFIVPRSGVSIVGGGDATVLRVGDGQNALRAWNILLTPGKLEGCIFRDFKVDGNAANNLLSSGVPARSNRALSATGGGKNVVVENVTFTGIPGNNTVAFSGTADCGNIRVQCCRFTEMGEGIPGNYNTDHTDIYLCGEGNKVLYNYFRSSNFMRGAAWEFHGDKGEAAGNFVYGISQGCWIAPVENPIFTSTKIHNNWFINVNTGPSFSTVDNAQFGSVEIYQNVMRMRAGAYASDVRIFGLYGPDKPGAFATELHFWGNKVYGVPGEAVVGAQPIQARKVNMHDNHFEDFMHSIRMNASGGALGGGYDYHDVILQNNTSKNATAQAIYYLISKCKSLVVTGNSCVIDAAVSVGLHLNGTADNGLVEGNHLSPLYTYPIAVSNAGMANVSFNQAGRPGERYTRYNAASLVTGLNKRVQWPSTAKPTSGNFAPGDIIEVTTPALGQPKGWICTAYGNPGQLESMGNL